MWRWLPRPDSVPYAECVRVGSSVYTCPIWCSGSRNNDNYNTVTSKLFTSGSMTQQLETRKYSMLKHDLVRMTQTAGEVEAYTRDVPILQILVDNTMYRCVWTKYNRYVHEAWMVQCGFLAIPTNILHFTFVSMVTGGGGFIIVGWAWWAANCWLSHDTRQDLPLSTVTWV